MGKNSRFPYSIVKQGSEPLLHRDRKTYPEHERACRVYSQFLAAYTEEELASFFEIPVSEVERDLQHISGLLPTKVLIGQWNDRARLLLQRSESERYRRLMSEALSVEAMDYLKAGISPASALREFREATGMVSKAEPLAVSVTQNIGISPGKISSAEDLIRAVIATMSEQNGQLLPMPGRDGEDRPEGNTGGGAMKTVTVATPEESDEDPLR